MSSSNDQIVVTGGGGFVGRRVVRRLVAAGVSRDRIVIPRSADFDLRQRDACDQIVAGKTMVIHLAATVGGIAFNKLYPAEAFYDNAIMGVNLIDASFRAGVEKFVGIGSVCSYPKFAPVPFREEELWDGYPEETNASYGLAKKMLLVQSQAYRAQYGFNAIHLLMTNLYGPEDNFDPEDSHVIPGLILRFFEAKAQGAPQVSLWGTGSPSREFLYVDDAAEGIVLAALRYNSPEPVNLGTGGEVTIRELANLIAGLIGFEGTILWDPTRPDGQPRRSLDTSLALSEFGFEAKTSFEIGLQKTINWYLATRR